MKIAALIIIACAAAACGYEHTDGGERSEAGLEVETDTEPRPAPGATNPVEPGETPAATTDTGRITATGRRSPWKDLNMTEEGKVQLSDEEWQLRLTPDQYRVLRQAGTERAYTGKYDKTTTPGTYLCVACGNELFTSKTKYDSGCGWPAFFAAEKDALNTDVDYKIGYARTEVRCSRCDSHLGHVFDDGPRPTGKRYCINSVCLLLDEDEADK